MKERGWKRLRYWAEEHCREMGSHFYLQPMQHKVSEETTHNETKLLDQESKRSRAHTPFVSLSAALLRSPPSQPTSRVSSNIQQRSFAEDMFSVKYTTDLICAGFSWYCGDAVKKNCTEKRCPSNTAPLRAKKNHDHYCPYKFSSSQAR